MIVIHLHNRKRGKLFPEDELTRRTQPFIQDRSVNGAKIGVEFQIAIIESTGHDKRELECSFLSSFHGR